MVLEFKLLPDKVQVVKIDEAIRATQFVRNKCVRLWMDTGQTHHALNRYCAVLAKEFPFAGRLDAQARQSAAERASYAIHRHEKPDKSGNLMKRPSFQKDNRSVEYKQTGWKLSQDRRRIKFTDGIGIGEMKMLGTRDLCQYDKSLIKRVRIVRRADMYFVQFCMNIDRKEELQPSGKTIGLDVGLSSFYTDSDGVKIECPKFLRKSEKHIKTLQRRVNRKRKGSSNRRKAVVRLSRKHLQVQRQRKDFAVKLARCVVMSNDVIAFEDLQVRNMVRNHHLAKSIMDASWSQFRNYVSYFGNVFGRITIAVPPQYTSQDCSNCGNRVKKSLSERTHRCTCGCVLDRDENAAKNILRLGLEYAGVTLNGTAGHAETDPSG